MTRRDLIGHVARKGKVDMPRAEHVVEAVFDSLVVAFSRGERAEIRGFVTFSVRRHEGYAGRNPKTGESIEVRAKRLPHFKPGAELRALINLRASENVVRPAPVAHAAAKGSA